MEQTCRDLDIPNAMHYEANTLTNISLFSKLIICIGSHAI